LKKPVSKCAFQVRNLRRYGVVVNLVCYRRLGHNEQDDPSITLPLRSQARAVTPLPGVSDWWP
jgi:2-oxoglutarate dehydrogenase complex dehydrogenase (E1) component-like enzyme